MQFETPSLRELIVRARTDLQAALAGADAALRRSLEFALSLVIAGMAHGLYGFLRFISRQLFSATAEKNYLVRDASTWGLTLKPASKAIGPGSITGSNGSVCPMGTLWQRTDGRIYVQDADVTIALGVATIAVTAQLAGSAGNADAGSPLSLVSPVLGINATAVVAVGGLVDGFDEESTEELRSRLIFRKSNPPRGGGPGDWILWAREVAGVTKAWERPGWNGPGRVGVAFVVGDDPLTMIPGLSKVAEVQAKLVSKRPIISTPEAFAPAGLSVAYTMAIVPDTAANRTAVETYLKALHRSDADLGATFYLSHIRTAIGAAGLTDYTLASPNADVVPALNQLPIYGGVTFT